MLTLTYSVMQVAQDLVRPVARCRLPFIDGQNMQNTHRTAYALRTNR
jgi:hypothetical protein